MKDLADLTVCTVDYGTFIGLAQCMGKQVKKSLYYSPYETEYRNIETCVYGDGMSHIERVDDFMGDLGEIDLFLFPDIGYGGLQKHLLSLGKLVWGSRGASDLELYRTRFLKVIAECGLEVPPYVVCRGLTELSEVLKKTTDKWVKVNRYRDQMETWHHIDWRHSERMMESLACAFGPLKEHVVFVVQEAINDALEVGYDGWAITDNNGQLQFPPLSYQGYEKKNQLYLGSARRYEELPSAVREINEKISPALACYGYRNFWATEIRIKDGIPHFIDPTARMAGQTMEHQLLTCENLPEVIYEGAKGNVAEPKFETPFAVEATLHLAGECEDWRTVAVPEDAEHCAVFYHCCFEDGAFHFPPSKNDEIGVVCGHGDTIEEAIENLKDNFELFKDTPVTIELSGFADLIEQIEDAESQGVKFSEDETPDPAIALT